MFHRVLDVAHRVTVLGLVGMTFAGGYTVFSGLYELASRRKALEAAAANMSPKASNVTIPAATKR